MFNGFKRKNFVFIFRVQFCLVLKNAFDAFDQEKNGFISVTMVGTILAMLGHQLDEKMLNEIVAEVDEDGSGQIEFEEFCTLAARFLVEEDAEAMQQELKEAFRLYDKEGSNINQYEIQFQFLRNVNLVVILTIGFIWILFYCI